ncbi:MAG: glycoside hydrolase family 88 protein [Haloarculaceae archaeon]
MADIDPDRLGRVREALLARVDRTLAETGERFPYFYDGGWTTTPDGNWCGGHWIRLLWLAADHRDDGERFAVAAREHTERMREYMPRESMFCGMNFHYAGFRGYDATGDRSLFGLGLEGADAMAALYDERARQVPLGGLDIEGPEQFRGPESDHGPPGDRLGAVDAVYVSLPVLWRAYRETGDPRFRDVAVSHADRHLDWYVREDGRTWHHAVFDEAGGLERQYNELAHSDETCWARGQGWSIAGLARAYRETGAERYLSTLERTVDYYREHTPDDGVPFWDFETPERPDTHRDTSAAALVAYGLGRLPDGDQWEKDRVDALREYGLAVLDSLLADYLVLDEDDPQYGAVLQGCFNAPGEYATDSELLWTDYYVAETVAALLDRR